MHLNLTEDEYTVIKGLLIGMMQEKNRLLDNDYYITKEQKELFEIAEGLLEKMEESK